MCDMPRSLTSLKQKCVQDHWKLLDASEKENLREQLDHLDLEAALQHLEEAKRLKEDSCAKLEPLPEPICENVLRVNENEMGRYQAIGMHALHSGKVGIILLAGGQGTRLNFARPKALYNLGLPSGKSLLQLQAEKIQRLDGLTDCHITWYIMCSPSTILDIEDTLIEKNYYGLPEDSVVVFSQGTMPCFGHDGQVLFSEKGQVAESPDGNGGLYRALLDEAILDDMEDREIEYLFMYCVDNVLVKIADPEFIGFCLSRGAECGNKVVERSPGETVGVTCLQDGAPAVVEYSELSKERAEDNRFNAANLCIHYFTRSFLYEVAMRETELPVHLASKKIPYVDSNGKIVKPEEPNGYKLEKFVFDAFRFTRPEKFAVWYCEREAEFAPLKRATGSEGTPQLCREALYRLHADWIRKAGGILVKQDQEDEQAVEEGMKDKPPPIVEISPLVSYNGEGLVKRMYGKEMDTPLHLTRNKLYH